MVRKAYIIGTAALGLALTVLTASPALAALESSARHVEQAVHGVQVTSGSLSPVERLVFGLILANRAPQRQGAVPSGATPRT